MLGIGLVIVIIAVTYLLVAYNRLVMMRNRVKEPFATIEAYLQERFEALTEVAEMVICYATNERETLALVNRMRTGLKDHQLPAEKLSRYVKMEKYLHMINVQVDNYPELKAGDEYLKLQRSINILEEKLSASRRIYNTNVTSYNTMISIYPYRLFARIAGFKSEILLKMEGAKRAEVNWTVS
ncbi:LemA family protein [Paenibacillus sp. FSL R10-2734]|uniref:LemA family protein n=1 Tax=Paenibacillus sp. FSL R10-2734 TaxID=2954691 RepID=UPI0030DD4FD5